MTPHLSDLVLDAVAVDLPGSPAARRHLAQCAACQLRLQQIIDDGQALQASPSFEQVWSRLPQPSRPPRRAKRVWLWPSVFVLAAASALLVVRRPPQGDTPKGGFSLQIVPLKSTAPQSDGLFHPGDEVVLSVNPLEAPYVLVLGADESGRVIQVWPSTGGASGRVPVGARTRLSPPFVVTPGSLALYAFFSDRPIPAKEAIARYQSTLAGSGSRGQSVPLTPPPDVPGEVGRAHAVLEISPR